MGKKVINGKPILCRETYLESAVACVEVAAAALRGAVRAVLAQELRLGHAVHLGGSPGCGH